MNFIKTWYPQADFSEIGEIDYRNKENEKGDIVAFGTRRQDENLKKWWQGGLPQSFYR